MQLLPNGNLLITNGPLAQEVDKDKKVVWEVGKPTVQSAESVQRLTNGHTVIADNAGPASLSVFNQLHYQ